MDNVIKELKLQLGKKEVSLTMEQAKKLKDALDELFGKEVIKEHHYHHDYWEWYPYWYSTPITVSYPQISWESSTGNVTAGFDTNTNALTMKVA